MSNFRKALQATCLMLGSAIITIYFTSENPIWWFTLVSMTFFIMAILIEDKDNGELEDLLIDQAYAEGARQRAGGWKYDNPYDKYSKDESLLHSEFNYGYNRLP